MGRLLKSLVESIRPAAWLKVVDPLSQPSRSKTPTTSLLGNHEHTGKQAKVEISTLNEQLEARVVERTNELRKTNEELRKEIIERKRAEEAVLHAQSRMESVLDSVADIHILFDRDWHYLYVNEAAVRAMGRQREQILGRTLWEIFPDIVGTELDHQYHRAMHDGVAVTFDFHYLTLNTWWENRFYPSPFGLSVFATDITERKFAEQALRESEERFRQIAENLQDVIWMVDSKVEQLLYVNPTYEKIWGRSSASLYEDIQNFIEPVHPDDREIVLRMLEDQKQHQLVSAEYRIIQPDGSVHWIRDRSFPVRNSAGEIYRIAGVAEDITESKQSEEKLQQSNAQLQNILDSLFVFVGLFSIEGVVLEANRAPLEAAGLKREDLIGMSFPKTYWWSYAPAVQNRVGEALRRAAKGEVVRYDEVIRIATGKFLTVDCAFGPLRDAHGRIVKIVGSAMDITERTQAEQALHTTTELLRALSANVQSAREEEGARIARELHDELGSALTSLRWGLDEIDSILSSTANNGDADSLRTKIAIMTTMVGDTLNTVRRISSELRPSLLDEVGLIATIEWEARQFEARTGILCFFHSLAGNIHLAREQSTAIFRIFQEALTNILRHAKATRVDVTAAEAESEFVLTIKDNGRGITDEEKSGKKSLGLLGMRERTHLIGGEVDITGIGGQGTVVTVRVPFSEAQTV